MATRVATDDVAAACRVVAGHKRDVGYVMRATIETAARRGELYVSPCGSGIAVVWRRRDLSTTLHTLAVDAPMRGQGVASALLVRVVADSRANGHTAIVARCPAELLANDWYLHRGFAHIGTDPGKARPLNVWRLSL